MAKTYFRFVPDFDYVSRLEGQKNISEYTRVKNLFKRAKVREDLFNDLSYFTKYKIVGNDRPDQVAFKVYGSQNYDWVVLLANNIVNFQSEWPMSQDSFYNYMIKKYGTEVKFYEDHHYETKEVKDGLGRIVVRSGLEVPKDYTIKYYDTTKGSQLVATNITTNITNYDYESKKQDDLRNIFLIRPEFLNVVIENIEEIMPYKPNSSQFESDELVVGDNIRLYS